MKRFFKVFFSSLLLIMSSSSAWGQFMEGIDMNKLTDPQTWYYVNMSAQNSTSTGGSGQVKLMTTDLHGNRIYDQFMGMDIEADMQYALWPNGNPSDFASSVTQTGFSLIYMPGVETEIMGVVLSSYAYYAAWAKADDGSYFDGWSYVDGGTEQGTNGAETDYIDGVTNNFAVFKILPDNAPGFTLTDESVIIGKTNRVIYATFRPVQVVDYESLMGEVEAAADNIGHCQITVHVAGKNIDAADFNTPVITGTGWSVSAWSYDEPNEVINIDVMYTAQAGVEANKEYKTTMTVSSKAGSTLVIPVTIRTVDPARGEATLKVGETEQTGTFAEMLAAANAATESPVVLTLTKDVTASATLSNSASLNLNGYKLSGTLTIATGANVTIDYSKYGGQVAGEITVAGTLNADGGQATNVTVNSDATLNENGLTITGQLTNKGTTTVTNGNINTITSQSSLKLQGGHVLSGLTITDGTANLERCTIDGNVAISGGNVTTEKLATFNAGFAVTGGSAIINCGKFNLASSLSGAYTFVSAYFKSVEGFAIPSGKQVWNVTAGPEKAAGYIYFVGDAAAQQAAGVAVCTIGETGYSTLEDALAYANNNPDEVLTIVMQSNYTLPAGYYTLPANAMLLIPYEEGQETGHELIERIIKNSVMHVDWVPPYEFRRLTLSDGVNLDVYGTIEISGRQFASDEAYAATPYGAYGHIVMSEGAHITMQGGALMRAWGYMTGKGEMDVRRGAKVFEQFQMGDWKGGQMSMNMLTDGRHVFPLTQYYMQNIESPVKYHPGAWLSTATAVSAALGGMALSATANDINIVGVTGQGNAMFLMDNEADAENTWVRKWYDVDRDIQTYEVNSGAHIGSMVLDLGNIGGTDLQMHSGWFNLPITNNMKIHLLSGYMDFTQSTELLPGAEVEVDKESTVAIVHNDNSSVVSGSLYVYDADDWGAYAYDGSGNTQTKAVRYSPSWFAKNGTGVPTVRDLNNLNDATINVHGTFDTNDGYVLTSGHGANIFSTNADAGTFMFTAANLPLDHAEDVYQCYGKNSADYKSQLFYPVKLKNGNGTYVATAGAEEGKSYCYIDNEWRCLEMDGCIMIDKTIVEESGWKYYAKPQGYVELSSADEDADHLYHSADGLHDYILEGDCQWWEVEKVEENLYHSLHPLNKKYYYWDDSQLVPCWSEKRFTITWLNWDGTPVDEYYVPYYSMAEYLGTNPTREPGVDYTYDFTGWQPALAPVTADVTYTATYEAKQRKYTVIFQTEGGQEIERHFLTRDEMPVCENEPSKPGHILRWQPAIAAVTGNATYTATWLEEKPATWTIRFVNYDGTELQSRDVEAGQMPEEPATPAKESTSEYSYTFIGWKPALEPATRDLTYTAQFKENSIIVTPDYGSYERDVTIGRYGTLCLPQDGVIEGAMLLSITGYNPSTRWIYCDAPANDTKVEAGVPYIFLPTETKIVVNFSSGDTKPVSSANGLYGVYNETFTVASDADNIYFLKNNEIVHAAATSTITDHRAYIKLDEVKRLSSEPAPVPGRRRVVFGATSTQVTTGISDIVSAETAEKILLNGQIYIVRSNHLYDLTGRMVH